MSRALRVAVACVTLALVAACSSGSESPAAQEPIAQAPTVAAVASDPTTAPVAPVPPGPDYEGLGDVGGEPLTEERLRLYAAWQGNETFERDVRNSVILVNIFFREDGSHNDDETVIAEVQKRFVDDPVVLELLAAVEADFEGAAVDTGLRAPDLAMRVFPTYSSHGGPLGDIPTTDVLEGLVAEGNERLEPLRGGYLEVVQQTIAAGYSWWVIGLGLGEKNLITEYVDPARALTVAPALAGAIADLEAAIPADGRAADDIEVRHAFGRFAIAMSDLVGEPALDE